jgi:hypothetical protein
MRTEAASRKRELRPAFAKLMASTATIAQLMGRNISVGVDLGKTTKRPPDLRFLRGGYSVQAGGCIFASVARGKVRSSSVNS